MISNTNLEYADVTTGVMQDYFNKESAKYTDSWGAFTIGIVLSDTLAEELSLHHQFHLPAMHPYSEWIAQSFFVSISMRGDTQRAPKGHRVLNISTHCLPRSGWRLGPRFPRQKEGRGAALAGAVAKRSSWCKYR